MDTKKKILDVALTLFSEKGYGNVYVSHIAEGVGIKAPSLYKHYKSKRDIFEDRENVYLWIDELELVRNQLPIELYDILPEKGYDPVDRDNLNNYRESLYNSNETNLIESTILDIHTELLPLADKMQELYREREDQLMLLGKHFF